MRNDDGMIIGIYHNSGSHLPIPMLELERALTGLKHVFQMMARHTVVWIELDSKLEVG